MYPTGIAEENLTRCDSLAQLKEEILPLLQDQRTAWANKMEQILAIRSCRELARLCRVSEPAVRKWRRGALPQSRDMYIRIGFAAGYTLEEMNSLLMRYGKHPQLYIKSLEDSACMFVLQSETLPHSYETYLELLELVRRAFQQGQPSGPVYATVQLADSFSGMQSTRELEDFVRTHAPAYRQSYEKLYSFIIAYLAINLDSPLPGEGRKPSFHAMATESGWPSSLRHCVSQIRGRRWFPQRSKIISLGLHLNMDTEAINRMLSLAQMEPLYPKSPVEAAILWAIEEKKLNSQEDAIIPDGSGELYAYVRQVLGQLDLRENEYFTEEL